MERRDNSQPKRIDELMKEFGFRADAAESTSRALIINLVRSAYGVEAAREFIRQLNAATPRAEEPISEPAEEPPVQLKLFG